MAVQALPDQITGGNDEVPNDWLAASSLAALVREDPSLVWLKYHGAAHGFEPDNSPYEFTDFIFGKGREFEDKWIQELAPEAVRVCIEAFDVRSVQKVLQTWELMQDEVPIIAQPALWFAPERIFGVPDLLVHSAWIHEKFPELLRDVTRPHYVVVDMKFTTELDSNRAEKRLGLTTYSGQVRLYSFMLGHLQGFMPTAGFLVTRDRIDNPLPVQITANLEAPLDDDLATSRDQYLDIKLNGANYLPWRDNVVSINLANKQDDPWHAAKKQIARDRIPGGHPGLVYQIGERARADLADRGYATLQSLLDAASSAVPLEECYRIGATTAPRIRAILHAIRLGKPILPDEFSAPPARSHEFFVDLEFFSNVNVDFDRQWPTLDGCEMIFMIGVGWEEEKQWRFEWFAAEAEDQTYEPALLQRFIDFLNDKTGGALEDGDQVGLYHWTGAEISNIRRACDRHELSANDRLRNLPWIDLQKAFHNGPIGIPGALGFGLKEVATALGACVPAFHVEWPGELDSGLRAMVLGWRAYESDNPLMTAEMTTLIEYLETDCKAVWSLLRWLRSSPESGN